MEDEIAELHEVPLPVTSQPLTDKAVSLIKEGRAIMPRIQCFDFVPSKYETAWNVLAALPRGRLCEWGSGLGIIVGLAELLGHSAFGVEIDDNLADTSRSLLRSQGLHSPIETGSYMDLHTEADYYYVYSWPSQFAAVQQRFQSISPSHACLLLCYGHDDIRCLKK
jgi:hypothetical protein